MLLAPFGGIPSDPPAVYDGLASALLGNGRTYTRSSCIRQRFRARELALHSAGTFSVEQWLHATCPACRPPREWSGPDVLRSHLRLRSTAGRTSDAGLLG